MAARGRAAARRATDGWRYAWHREPGARRPRGDLEPRFVTDFFYFLEWTLEPGEYYFVGRETVAGREVVRIEFYPTASFWEEAGERINRGVAKTSMVTLWVDPENHQIVKYAFENAGLDFLRFRWLLRADGLRATMELAPVRGVWMPARMTLSGRATTALGEYEMTLTQEFFDYRQAETGSPAHRSGETTDEPHLRLRLQRARGAALPGPRPTRPRNRGNERPASAARTATCKVIPLFALHIRTRTAPLGLDAGRRGRDLFHPRPGADAVRHAGAPRPGRGPLPRLLPPGRGDGGDAGPAGAAGRGSRLAVALGVVAAYLLVFVRMSIPTERSHLIEYGVVALFIHEALTERASHGRRVPAPTLLAVLAATLIGVVDECIQLVLPSRVFDPIDMLFNLLAAVMAVTASSALGWARKRSTYKSRRAARVAIVTY